LAQGILAQGKRSRAHAGAVFCKPAGKKAMGTDPLAPGSSLEGNQVVGAAGVAEPGVQQDSDAFSEVDGPGDWSDLLSPALASGAASTGGRLGREPIEGTHTPVEETTASLAPGVDVGVSTLAECADAGCQAAPSSFTPAGSLGVGVSALSDRDSARITGFLADLRSTNAPADASTVEAMLRLLQTLPAPEGRRVLLDAIRREHPALFQRLHESMLRTQKRMAAGGGGDKRVPSAGGGIAGGSDVGAGVAAASGAAGAPCTLTCNTLPAWSRSFETLD